jgi:hypothetical protein
MAETVSLSIYLSILTKLTNITNITNHLARNDAQPSKASRVRKVSIRETRCGQCAQLKDPPSNYPSSTDALCDCHNVIFLKGALLREDFALNCQDFIPKGGKKP